MVEVKNLGVPYESEIIYLDDVRLTKLPYETTDDIEETTYDTFGNVTKSYQYNPIDQSVESTEYVYNSAHQVSEQTQKLGSARRNKIVNTYSNGLLTDKKEYGIYAGAVYIPTIEEVIFDYDNLLLTKISIFLL